MISFMLGATVFNSEYSIFPSVSSQTLDEFQIMTLLVAENV